ncbi:metalloendopeptidase [Aureococcus anophagefferens]|nr:metalloendopeptidase [Aureococcus anophagefferens]
MPIFQFLCQPKKQSFLYELERPRATRTASCPAPLRRRAAAARMLFDRATLLRFCSFAVQAGFNEIEDGDVKHLSASDRRLHYFAVESMLTLSCAANVKDEGRRLRPADREKRRLNAPATTAGRGLRRRGGISSALTGSDARELATTATRRRTDDGAQLISAAVDKVIRRVPRSAIIDGDHSATLHLDLRQEGDIVSFDVSIYAGGALRRQPRTAAVGADDWANALVATTQRALDDALATVKPGACLTAIGDACADAAATRDYGAVRQYSATHRGVFHAPPLVQHCRNRDAFTLVPGHVFTIEPMLTERSPELYVADDGWTVVTRDAGQPAGRRSRGAVRAVRHDGRQALTLPE